MRRWMICLMVLSRFAHAGSAADSDSVKYHLDPMVIIASKILGPQSELPASI